MGKWRNDAGGVAVVPGDRAGRRWAIEHVGKDILIANHILCESFFVIAALAGGANEED